MVQGSTTEVECCMDSLVDDAGNCCDAAPGAAAPSLDRHGVCCPSGRVDGCGECDPAVWGMGLDTTGFCCPVRTQPLPSRMSAPSHCCVGLMHDSH